MAPAIEAKQREMSRDEVASAEVACAVACAVTLTRTTDLQLVRTIITHPEIYPYVSDDGSPAPEDFHPPEHGTYVLALDADELLGVFALAPHGTACWEFHTCLLPTAHGRRAIDAIKGLFVWMWSNTTCQRIVTNVPVNNRPAAWIARAVGMERFGLNQKSFQSGGVLYDQILFGVSKPMESAQCQ